MKRQRLVQIGHNSDASATTNNIATFDLLSEDIVFLILDLLHGNPLDEKAFSLVCKSFYALESRHRKTLRPLRSEHLPGVLRRYRNLERLDMSLCPRITDPSLAAVAETCGSTVRSVDLSRSKFFSHVGLWNLARSCVNLVEINVSNATKLGDPAAQAISEARNLERLWMERCRLVTDIGIGCVAVGCRKLRFLSLKWCVGVGDLGVGLIAVKCKEIRSIDLSYMRITNKCLPPILKLPYLEDLIVVGCFNIDDDSLAVLKQECKSLKTLDMSSCQNVSHVGLSSITSATESLQQLNLAYGSPVTLALVDSLQKLSMLQSIKLDGCLVTCSGLKAIGDWCVSLTELSLSKCSGVMDEGLSFLVTKHRELRKLDLTCCRKITRTSIVHITNSCTSLTTLKLESCSLVASEAFVLIGQCCPCLEVLDLTDSEVDDEGLKSLSRCCRLSSLKLGICPNISDEGLSQIGFGCRNLIELDLYRSVGMTDVGVSEIASSCTGLKAINLSYCTEVTDCSLISLSKCSRVNTLEVRGCPHITSLGLEAIAVGCKQLSQLDIKKCYNVDDAGMIPLARSSKNLRQINLSYSSVTDVGLLSLVSVSYLQSLTILHVKGLTPTGLAAALLACGGLTKVKLQASFKQLLPQVLFEHLEARGCHFQWRDKAYQAELDPKCWMLQLADAHQRF